MQLSCVLQLISADLHVLNETIIQSLSSHVPMINQIGHYLVESGGKRIRPALVLLCAKACLPASESIPSTAIQVATIIEFIHTATLLHDDVVDGSAFRRGQPTANRVWDNASAVLVGDFLYSRAFQMMVSLHSLPAMQILANATNVIAEGEVLQLSHRFEPNVSEARYFEVIRFKTATLFEAAAQLGALITQADPALIAALGHYALHLGTAFQLTDDILDYQADTATWGKHLGDDLAEGKVTLPLIHALEKANPSTAAKIQAIIQQGKVEDIHFIRETLIETGALEYATQKATEEVEAAKKMLSKVPSSPYRDALDALATFALTRGN